MRMISKHILAALSLLLCAQSFPAQDPGPGTDGHRQAPQTEGAYRFDCGAARAEIRWRQERFHLGSAPSMSDALRVTLLQFSAPGHIVSDADLARIRGLFERLAWVESVQAWCYPSGSIELWLIAMPKRDWIGYFERDQSIEAEIPRSRIHTIEISRAGVIAIEEPEPLSFELPAEPNRDRRGR